MNTKHILLHWLGITALTAVAFGQNSTDHGLVVHEWGTFTSLQGSDGVPLKWNPLSSSHLPGFVYDWRHAGFGRQPTGMLALGPKGVLLSLQRLETPVIYFYSDHEQTIDLSVRFPKGGITEWFPQATAIGPSTIPPGPTMAKLDEGLHDLGVSPTLSLASLDPIGNITESLIEWRDLKILPAVRNKNPKALPADQSGSNYFTARETDSAYVQIDPANCAGTAPELEKFLFYRGVGDFATPLNVSMDAGNRISLFNSGTQALAHVLVLSIQANTARFVSVGGLETLSHKDVVLDAVDPAQPLQLVQTRIAEAMERALVAEGLFRREAIAMVNTWQDSWFTEDGVRVLYLLPTAWTDEVLPMNITPAPSQRVRVMVGRAELITTEMEQQLATGIERVRQDRPGALEELYPLAARLGRFAEPAWNRALARAGLSAEDRTRLQGMLLASQSRSKF